MTNLTELKIAPKHTWKDVSPENPLRCTVSLRSKETTVETVLGNDDMRKILDLVSVVVAEAAIRNTNAFCDAALGVDAIAATAITVDGETS